MKFLLRTSAIIVVAIKRIFAQQWLALALVMGLVSSIVLVMSIPLYADAVYYRLLQEELTETGISDTYSRPRSPICSAIWGLHTARRSGKISRRWTPISASRRRAN